MSSLDLALTDGVDRETRRALVVAAGQGLAGIDRVEVLSNLEGRFGAPVRRTLLVWTTAEQFPDALHAGQVRIAGGVRVDPLVNPVRVEWAYRADRLGGDTVPGPTAADRQLVEHAVVEADRERVLVVRTSSSGDWSTYVLELTGTDGRAVPTGFDPPLARAPFAFTVDLPSDLDDRGPVAAPPPAVSPVPDYLARDYDGLRTRLLDRLATTLPDWPDRGPADPLVTVAELFAALGDRLATWQDAVAAEAYLGTARRRASLRRHARLLDYRMHDGCSARTWLSFTTDTTIDPLPAGTPVADGPPDGARPGVLPAVADVVRDGGIVFETCHPATLHPACNSLKLHSWGDPEHVLPVGCTSAFVQHPEDDPPPLRAGDVLILAAVGATGAPEDGDPNHRHAVRLVADPVPHSDGLAPRLGVLELQWSAADALPRPLVVAVRGDDGGPRLLAVALGNVVLADHGATVPVDPLVPEQVPVSGGYRPRLRRTGLTWADPPVTGPASATAALVPDPRSALPAVTVHDGTRTWEARADLLGGGPGAAAFVVEAEPDGTSRLRFGDGVAGRLPDAGTSMEADHRVGGGGAGNVAAGVLTTLLAPARGTAGVPPFPVGLRVTNPLAAAGGTDPESMATARERAPRAFRTQERAVTEADHAAVATAHPGVSRAVARRRWTGSWYCIDVAVDTDGGTDDATRRAALEADLGARRMAGIDVTVGGPVPVPLEIVMRVHLLDGYPRAEARRLLSAAFGTTGEGFFHPDRFTFGQSLELTEVVLAAMSVTGVDWVEVGDDDTGLRFRRWGRPRAGEAGNQRITAEPRAVLRADSDPSRPENGRVDFLLVGGS